MSIKKLPVVLAAVAAISLVLAPAALAGKGGRPKPSSGASTISLVLVDSADGLAHWNQRVTFNISTTATDQPWVHLKCFQNGTKVAEGWGGYFDGSLGGREFGLASGAWTGGAADCTAYLEKPDASVLASTSFHVYA